VTELLHDYGLLLLFAIIAAQAAGVAGLPGKTSLVVAAILAARGDFEIAQVIVVAAVAGIVGGYAGYAIGRGGGRRLLERPAVQKRLGRALKLMERLFERHGAKAVFIARFLPGAKVVAAPAAGVADMNWARFAFWHALGAIGFALGFGLAGYYGGEGAIELVERFGVYALAPLVLLAVALYVFWTKTGSSKKKVEPAPGHEVTRTRPPIRSASSRQM
jgi:membrane protein DedA with SNARE-associated domain